MSILGDIYIHDRMQTGGNAPEARERPCVKLNEQNPFHGCKKIYEVFSREIKEERERKKSTVASGKWQSEWEVENVLEERYIIYV